MSKQIFSAKRLFQGLLLVTVFVFAGCWGSKFTLIPPDMAKVDRAYVGDWDAVNSKGEHTAMVIRNLDDKLYYIELREKDDSNPDRYVGFLADVKGATFAHVRELKDDGSIPEAWIIMRISQADNKIKLEQLEDKFFDGKTINAPDQLRQVLEQNLNNEAMYAKDELITMTRVVKK